MKFTERQRAIVKAWAKHPTIAQASEALGISEHTFQTHLRRMRSKVNVNRTFDLYRYMQQHQML
ncbi:LuxR C-terminal-related transcriptional regulator [Flavilitoribacter nigricans]|nr:LuxR C-terminal-related transcriptional regulator [Flavilitoribacter nigricans]